MIGKTTQMVMVQVGKADNFGYLCLVWAILYGGLIVNYIFPFKFCLILPIMDGFLIMITHILHQHYPH